MIGWRQELALAACRCRFLGESLPESAKRGLAGRWDELLEELDNTRSDGGKVVAILSWRAEIETELAAVLLHAPLEGAGR